MHRLRCSLHAARHILVRSGKCNPKHLYSTPKPQAYGQKTTGLKHEGQKAGSLPQEAAENGKTLEIPEILRVYQAGKGKTAVVGVLKILPLVILGTNIGLNAYAAFNDPDQVSRNAVKSIAFTAIPLVYIFAASPYVVFVHLRLPASARSSRKALTTYAKRLPPDAQIGFTTISWYGRPRRTWTALSELKPVKSMRSLHNIRRVDSQSFSGRKWRNSDQTKFMVSPTKGKTFESSIWDKVASQIKAHDSKR